MAKRKRKRRGIALPWERQGSMFGSAVRGARWKVIGLVLSIIGAALLLWSSIEHRERVRTTRLSIAETRRAVMRFRIDERRCPSSLDELVHPPRADLQYLREVPKDGWGKTLFMRCPGRFDADDANIISAGPSGSFFTEDNLQ